MNTPANLHKLFFLKKFFVNFSFFTKKLLSCFSFFQKKKCSSPPREGGHKIGVKVKSLLQLEVHALRHLVPHVGGAVGVFVN